MSDREDFEEWYAKKNDGFCPSAYEGEYDFADAQACWEAWQEARAQEGGEAERLRGRVSELESLAADLVVTFDQTLTDTLMFEDYETLKRVVEPFRDAVSNPKTSAWILRKQAEAIKKAVSVVKDNTIYTVSLASKAYQKALASMEDEAQRLRDKADELAAHHD